MSAQLKGWAWPYGCPEPHYFVGKLSLCGAMRLTNPENERIDSRVVDTKDCGECVALLFPKGKPKRKAVEKAR